MFDLPRRRVCVLNKEEENRDSGNDSALNKRSTENMFSEDAKKVSSASSLSGIGEKEKGSKHIKSKSSIGISIRVGIFLVFSSSSNRIISSSLFTPLWRPTISGVRPIMFIFSLRQEQKSLQ